MAETANLLLPFLAAGQAQKHLTVNDAMERLDVLLMLSAKSRSLATPPTVPKEGDRYLVPSGANGDWLGEDGSVAAFLNGGWRFFAPRPGWRCFVEDEADDAVFASGVWNSGVVPGASPSALNIFEFEHAVLSGGAHSTAATLPAGAMVFGVTARVTESISGAASWSLGVGGASTRYGSGLPVAEGAAVTGVRGAPLAYQEATPLTVTPEGGSFSAGRLRLAVHYATFAAPAL